MEKKKTFTVMDSKKGKTFATLEEANAYEREHRKRTGEFVVVVAGTKTVTHTYVVQATPKKPTAKKSTAKPKTKAKKSTAKPKVKPTAKKTAPKRKSK